MLAQDKGSRKPNKIKDQPIFFLHNILVQYIYVSQKNLRVLAMGTAERISLKIQFEHLIAAIAQNCPHLERLEFR